MYECFVFFWSFTCIKAEKKNRTPGYITVALPTFLSIFSLLSLRLLIETAHFRLLTSSTMHAWQLFLTWSAKQLVNNLCIFQQKYEINFKNSHLRENQNTSVSRTEFAGSFVEETSGVRVLELDTRCVKWPRKHVKFFPNDKSLHILTIVLKHLWNALTKHNDIMKEYRMFPTLWHTESTKPRPTN